MIYFCHLVEYFENDFLFGEYSEDVCLLDFSGKLLLDDLPHDLHHDLLDIWCLNYVLGSDPSQSSFTWPYNGTV